MIEKMGIGMSALIFFSLICYGTVFYMNPFVGIAVAVGLTWTLKTNTIITIRERDENAKDSLEV